MAASAPTPQPPDSSSVNFCSSAGVICELRTFSASQIGSLLGLIVGIVIVIIHSLQTSSASSDLGALWQFWCLFLTTAVYYAIEEWILEERDFAKLRQLRIDSWPNARFLAYLEFYVRVTIVVILGFTATIPGIMMDRGVRGIDAGLLCLVFIFNLFLFWDVVVCIGGQVDMIWRVFWGDLGGALLCLGYFYWHDRAPVIAVFFLIIFAVIVLQLQSILSSDLVIRFAARDRLR